MAALSLSSPLTFSLYKTSIHKNAIVSLHNLSPTTKISTLNHSSTSLCFNPLSLSVYTKDKSAVNKLKSRKAGVVCYAAPLNASNLQWISAISFAALMVAKGTGAPKSFLVPLFALQAPASIISWIKGEYGLWSAFLALLVRLFYFIPGSELELPFVAFLMVIVAPYQVMNLRGTKEGTIISLVLAAYMAFQHFTRAGSLQKAFDQGSVIATIAIICIAAVSLSLLI